MLIGYGRASAADGDAAAGQVDALARAGVAVEDIHVDTASGARSARPGLDLVLERLRGGDTLVVTRLDRLARSVSHLVSLAAELRERGVGLRVLEQGIDTATADGRAKFEMLSVLAELRHELTASHTRDGLATARAGGRKGGRPPKLTPEQARQAQRLYDEGEHTVAQIAELLGVKRGTLYGHLDKGSVGRRPHAPKTRPRPRTSETDAPFTGPASLPTDRGGVGLLARGPSKATPPRSLSRTRRRVTAQCPSCGNEPSLARERVRHRQDLEMTWLYPNPHDPGRVLERRHCAACQPHDLVAGVECGLCADGPMLAGWLAERGADADPVRAWLAAHGWRDRPGLGLVCARHPVPAQFDITSEPSPAAGETRKGRFRLG
jgi:DNA invertase Pin-like site-specific DNA recombinase